jgi:hypothetical protein
MICECCGEEKVCLRCESCSSEVCDDCVTSCDNCGEQICDNCRCMGEMGDLCEECAAEEADEEEETEGE